VGAIPTLSLGMPATPVPASPVVVVVVSPAGKRFPNTPAVSSFVLHSPNVKIETPFWLAEQAEE
jgi:hypothetical protein